MQDTAGVYTWRVYDTKGPCDLCVQLASCHCSLKSLLFFTLGYSMPFINKSTWGSTCYSGGSPTVFKHKPHIHLELESGTDLGLKCKHLCSYMHPLWVESWGSLTEHMWKGLYCVILPSYLLLFSQSVVRVQTLASLLIRVEGNFPLCKSMFSVYEINIHKCFLLIGKVFSWFTV